MKAFVEQAKIHVERTEAISRRLDNIHAYLVGSPCPPSEYPPAPTAITEGVIPDMQEQLRDQDRMIDRLFQQLDAVEQAMSMEPPRLGTDGLVKAPR